MHQRSRSRARSGAKTFSLESEGPGDMKIVNILMQALPIEFLQQALAAECSSESSPFRGGRGRRPRFGVARAFRDPFARSIRDANGYGVRFLYSVQ